MRLTIRYQFVPSTLNATPSLLLDPTKLAARQLTPADVVAALQEQNVEIPAGQLGRPPADPKQKFQVTLRVVGRLSEPKEFESIVKREVIDRFDHKHLNEDTAEFARLNPTVENIAGVIWRLLAPRMAPARLVSVRVYETPKTCAECRGE